MCYIYSMDTRTRVNIEDYIVLYERGLLLNQIKPLKNQTYQIFKASGLDIRIVHRSKIYDNSLAYQKIKYFIQDNEYFYMIPVTTIKETIVGFILRGVLRSDYSTVSREFKDNLKRVPLMFGFNKKFLKFEDYKQCPPIVLCEGSKDCIFMSQFYPYVLAINTSSMGLNAQVLINLTNKFVLAYDNDKAGQEGIERDKKIFRNLGAQVTSLELSKKVKDCADYFNYPDKVKELKEELKYKIHKVTSF